MMSGLSDFAAFKALKWQALHGSFARRVVIRAFLFAIAISILPFMRLVRDNDPTNLYSVDSDECAADMGGYLDTYTFVGRILKPVIPITFPHMRYAQCKRDENLIMAMVRELMEKHLLNHDAKALCVGWGSSSAAIALRKLGFANADGVNMRRIFTLNPKLVDLELDYEDSSFDFVLRRDLDKVSVPALLVDEVERILKPGGIGALLVGFEDSRPGSLIKSANSVSSFLKRSTVIHLTSSMGFTFVAFKKKIDTVGSFDRYRLPVDCQSIMRNKPLIMEMEPLLEEKPNGQDRRIAYLPSFINVSHESKLVFIDMGARDAANFSHGNGFLPAYPIDSRAFDIFIVDHDVLVLSSHVNKPGVTFIYHPGLAGIVGKDTSPSVQDIELPMDDEEFDFLTWFKETVSSADFVVLKMNMGAAELKFLFELFETGAICSVDELLLQCSDSDLENGLGNPDESCINLFKGLRRCGIFVHQWWGY
ncbi:hypothetical protein Nepgr_024962 [Nepenthes gracilis]|uniref:DUF7870 domain-containing protein n=1 Tax=Nepenthes gracilis TaxID=150966 RepID=A0AAD3T618_NEPGR|nr:hypothetical protein Nepgr_024962 [Nepenthes gracilis]